MSQSGRADVMAGTVILVFLVGLGLPAMAKSRNADQLAKCTANLGAVGRATLAFGDANDAMLPHNLTLQPVPGADPPRNALVSPLGSWNILLLPHLGEEKVYRTFDLKRDWYDSTVGNQRASSAKIASYVCPASPTANRTVKTTTDLGTEFLAGATDFCGVPAAYMNNNVPDKLVTGAMNQRFGSARIRRVDIKDGGSVTILIVEMADKPNQWRAGKLQADHSAKVYDATGKSIGNGQWAAPNWNHLRSHSWDGTSQFGPCAVNCSNSAAIYGFHDGGANALFVDGSVRFLSQKKTTQELLIALVSIDGREPISPNDF